MWRLRGDDADKVAGGGDGDGGCALDLAVDFDGTGGAAVKRPYGNLPELALDEA